MLDFSKLKKNLKKDVTGLKTIKIALLADTASQLLHQALKGYGIELNVNFDIYEADYDQIEQQVYEPLSDLYGFEPDFIIIIRSSEHLLTKFYKQSVRNEYAANFLAETNDLFDHVARKSNAKIITNTFTEIHDGVFGNYANKNAGSYLYHLRKINIGLMEIAQKNKSLFITDIAGLSANKGYEFTFDPKMYINADMIFSLDFLPIIAQNITQVISSITGNFKKCLILDLDNTLWGGIIGDDGMEGIQIGHLGIGKAFTELQLWCKELKKRGIILAVCSKNTEYIAQEPFIKHPEMELRLDDIAVFVANWENKIDNIKYIQNTLKIGFDSMVFLDDNPFEREMVKASIPELTVPDLPEDPAEYLLFLRNLNLFETAFVTEEDKNRTAQYQQEAKRNILQSSFADEKSFLQNLEMSAIITSFNKFNIPRVVQLIARSNQFNLRTIRYSENEIESISTSLDYFTIALNLADKFGDHGLIAVIILKKQQPDVLFIDNWIMSCRVLKRGMEDFTLNSIIDIARSNNFNKIVGEYIPTKKNELVKDHYQKMGFKFSNDQWILTVNEYIHKDTFINKHN